MKEGRNYSGGEFTIEEGKSWFQGHNDYGNPDNVVRVPPIFQLNGKYCPVSALLSGQIAGMSGHRKLPLRFDLEVASLLSWLMEFPINVLRNDLGGGGSLGEQSLKWLIGHKCVCHRSRVESSNEPVPVFGDGGKVMNYFPLFMKNRQRIRNLPRRRCKITLLSIKKLTGYSRLRDIQRQVSKWAKKPIPLLEGWPPTSVLESRADYRWIRIGEKSPV